MRKHMFPFLFAMMVLTVGQALGATTPAQRAATIAPFVDEQTVAVGYLDLGALAPDALGAEMERAGVAVDPHMVGALKTDLGHLTDAGAREVYVVVSTAYLLYPPYVVVIPLRQNVDADAIAAVLRDLKPETAVVNGALCAGPPGVIARFRSLAPAARPELAAALEAARDAPLVIALIPTADNRRVIEETLPVLPECLGGGPSSVLTRGVTWAVAWANLPPQPSLTVLVQSAEHSGAVALGKWATAMLASLAGVDEIRARPGLDRLVATLVPTTKGDKLSLEIGADRARQMLGALLARAREDAVKFASRAQMHRILMACDAYGARHEGEWPETLELLRQGGYLQGPADLRNPDRAEAQAGYTYRRPAKDAAPGTVVLYEAFGVWPPDGVATGFRDLSITVIRDEQQFRQLLAHGR